MASVIPEMRPLQEATFLNADTGSGFRRGIALAMLNAANAGSRTTTISTTTSPAGDVLNTLNLLGVYGYTTSISGSTLTITW